MALSDSSSPGGMLSGIQTVDMWSPNIPALNLLIEVHRMKILITLITGIVLGLVMAHTSSLVAQNSSSHSGFADLHGSADSTAPSASVSLMQTDTALCDQPYFVEVYALSVEFFSAGAEHIKTEDFGEVLFNHARHSGHFTEQEAEGWIRHIKDIPGQLVEIYREDPTVLDSCYSFQVAAVGPPA